MAQVEPDVALSRKKPDGEWQWVIISPTDGKPMAWGPEFPDQERARADLLSFLYNISETGHALLEQINLRLIIEDCGVVTFPSGRQSTLSEEGRRQR